jgi:hypothetical protein
LFIKRCIQIPRGSLPVLCGSSKNGSSLITLDLSGALAEAPYGFHVVSRASQALNTTRAGTSVCNNCATHFRKTTSISFMSLFPVEMNPPT